MDENMSLEEINENIRRLEDNNRIRNYYSKNPDKQKAARDKWNKKYRNEYQREYNKRNKIK